MVRKTKRKEEKKTWIFIDGNKRTQKKVWISAETKKKLLNDI